MVYKVEAKYPFNHRVHIEATITMEAGEWEEVLDAMQESAISKELFDMLKHAVGEQIVSLTHKKFARNRLDETNVQNPKEEDGEGN